MNISFCGGAKEVGASCLLLRMDGRNILLDSGIRLNSRDNLPDFRLIQEKGGLDAIVVSHAHLDHTGSLPVISREYSRAPIFMTHATRDITRVLLYDSLKIMNREEEIPVYAENHVEDMLERIRCYSFQNPFTPFKDEDIEITFFQAGHILGASSIYLVGREGALFYSGDISVAPQRTVNGINIPKLRPDVLILESTYGERLHSSRRVEEQRLIDIVAEVTGAGGKVLIPAFALGRAQEVLLILRSAVNKKQLPLLTIYVDGMVKDILGIYRLHPNFLRPELARRVWREKDVFYSDSVKPVTSQVMRQKIADSSDPCCIVASSGMLTGGPSCFYAEHIIKGKNNFIAVTGYQDEEAPGRQLLNLLESSGEEEKVWGLSDKRIPVCCRLGKYGLSAHADRGELLGVIQKLSPRKIFLMHGSAEALAGLGREAQSQIRGEVFIPENGEEYTVSFYNPRKQLKDTSIPSLEKGLTSGGIDLEELWAHVKLYERGRGLTAEELLYILSGRRDYDEQELQDFCNTLLEEAYFKPDEKRLFIYHPMTEDEVQSLKEPQVMEVNEMLSLADSFFPKNTGLYRKGAQFEQKIALFSFSFPSVEVPGCGGRIREFEERTGWKVEINKQYNTSAIKPLLKSLLKEEKSLLKNVSFYNLQNVVRANFSTEPISGESLIRAFKEKTGLDLCLEYPGKAPEESEVLLQDDRQRMEQNAALSLIENVFKEAKHELFKKGIKSDRGGKYIELSFISSVIGENYRSWITDLEKETGWRITINPYTNQMELIQKATELLQEEGISFDRNPGIFQGEGVVRFKLNNPIGEETWNNMQKRFQEETGFCLQYILEPAK